MNTFLIKIKGPPLLSYHFSSVIAILLAVSSIPAWGDQQTLDQKLIELQRQREKLDTSAIFAQSQIDFLRISAGTKRPDDFLIKRLSNLKFPFSIREFINRYGFPDKTAIIQSPSALSRPMVIWEYGNINVFIGLSKSDETEIVSIVEATDWNFEKMKKNK